MKFSEMPYSRPDLEAMKANLTACTEAFLAADSAQEQIAQYDRVTDLSVEFNTMGSLPMPAIPSTRAMHSMTPSQRSSTRAGPS